MRLTCLAIGGILGLIAIAPVQAQWRVGAGVEYFTWVEDTAPEVREAGPRLTLQVGYLQDRDHGLLLGYAGKLYEGDVDYSGATLAPPHTPLSGTTHYTGMMNEAQVRYRLPPKRGYWLDLTAAMGIDSWRRELTSVQREDWRIGFLRLGFETDTPNDRGYIGGLGAKYPFYTWEDPHNSAIGLHPDTTLKPGKDWSLYAQVGYRFQRHWQLIGYVDSFRFHESSFVPLTSTNPALPSGNYGQPQSTMYTWGLKLEYVFR